MESLTPGRSIGGLQGHVAACDLPRDWEEATLQPVSGIASSGIGVSGPRSLGDSGSRRSRRAEVEPVERLAQESDAEVEWGNGELEELAAAMHARELDLLIADTTSRSKISFELL